MTTILKIAKGAEGRAAALGALHDAGLGVIEVEDWEAAAEALRNCDAALVVCDGAALEGVDPEALKKALAALADVKKTSALPPDIARTISHDLRTPLSAMAGWIHLMESGKLDDDAMKRAIQKLRANIDDQVRTIERYLGTPGTGRSG
jgi:signal transduction histidine kinase